VAVAGWILDKSAAARGSDPVIGAQLAELAGNLFICPVGELEQLYSARSARHYDQLQAELHAGFDVVSAPSDLLERALVLQRDLAHHHGMWHRTKIPDLLIAETAIHHGLGIVHVDRDFARIAEVRPLTVRALASPTAGPSARP
jgi:predicted nucleic acid-binding protein